MTTSLNIIKEDVDGLVPVWSGVFVHESEHSQSEVGTLVITDVAGATSTDSYHGSRFGLLFIEGDTISKFSFILFQKSSKSSFDCFR